MSEPKRRRDRYPDQVRERAVRMVFEHQGEYPSQWKTTDRHCPGGGDDRRGACSDVDAETDRRSRLPTPTRPAREAFLIPDQTAANHALSAVRHERHFRGTEHAIEQLMIRHIDCIDANDPLGAAVCFTEDGVGVYWGEYRGRAAIHAGLRVRLPPPDRDERISCTTGVAGSTR